MSANPDSLLAYRARVGRIQVRSPYDNQLLTSVETINEKRLEQVLSLAYGLFKNRNKWLPKPARIEILERCASYMRRDAEELALNAAREGGKPLIDSRLEVERAIDGVHNVVDLLKRQGGYTVPMGVNSGSTHRVSFSRSEPIGLVVAVSAFNHPLNLIVHQVAPAIGAGCPVIVKPAEDTPLSCFRFVDLLREAGLPEGWCQPIVPDDLALSTRLVTDPRVGFFSFIGSANVGWMLRSKLAPGTRCSLEHGGAAPVILTDDADIEAALPLLAKGGFYHAGQVCVSVQRVYAHRSIARKVKEKLGTLASALRVGDPSSEDTEVGPLIRRREVERVHAWVEEARYQGTETVSGGYAIDDTCYAPTVLFNPAADLKVSTREIFGPVICVYPYDSLDDAIAQANMLPYAFQASVFTSDIDTAAYVADRIDASAVMVNDHTAFRVDWMPFAGLRESGLGVGGIPYTFRDMQVEKMMVLRSNALH